MTTKPLSEDDKEQIYSLTPSGDIAFGYTEHRLKELFAHAKQRRKQVFINTQKMAGKTVVDALKLDAIKQTIIMFELIEKELFAPLMRSESDSRMPKVEVKKDG